MLQVWYQWFAFSIAASGERPELVQFGRVRHGSGPGSRRRGGARRGQSAASHSGVRPQSSSVKATSGASRPASRVASARAGLGRPAGSTRSGTGEGGARRGEQLLGFGIGPSTATITSKAAPLAALQASRASSPSRAGAPRGDRQRDLTGRRSIAADGYNGGPRDPRSQSSSPPAGATRGSRSRSRPRGADARPLPLRGPGRPRRRRRRAVRRGSRRSSTSASSPSPARRADREAQPSAGRRRAAPLVAFTDDDCRPRPGWLEALLEASADGPSTFLQGRTDPDPDERTCSTGSPARWRSTGPSGWYRDLQHGLSARAARAARRLRRGASPSGARTPTSACGRSRSGRRARASSTRRSSGTRSSRGPLARAFATRPGGGTCPQWSPATPACASGCTAASSGTASTCGARARARRPAARARRRPALAGLAAILPYLDAAPQLARAGAAADRRALATLPGWASPTRSRSRRGCPAAIRHRALVV